MAHPTLPSSLKRVSFKKAQEQQRLVELFRSAQSYEQVRKWSQADQISLVGVVYLIRQKGTSICKIGHSFQIKKRLVGLQTASPNPLELVTYVPASRRTEKAIHSLFKRWRVRGEWFDDVDGVIGNFFISLKKAKYLLEPSQVKILENQWGRP